MKRSLRSSVFWTHTRGAWAINIPIYTNHANHGTTDMNTAAVVSDITYE